MQSQKKIYTVEEAKRSIEKYCAYQERCHKEVSQKLRTMGMISLVIDEIIGHLLEHNFLNETRFAQAFARGKFKQKKWGKNRVLRELKQRNISAYNLTLALKEIDEKEYLNTFNILAKKRIQQLTTETNLQKKKKKFADYMLYRGWESHLIYEYSNTIKD